MGGAVATNQDKDRYLVHIEKCLVDDCREVMIKQSEKCKVITNRDVVRRAVAAYILISHEEVDYDY